MSEGMKENPQLSNEWVVKTSEWEGFNWKAENDSDYLWNSDSANVGMGMSKAHTSGTPSDEQASIGDGVNEVNREPQMLEVDPDFNNPREMGSVTENPTVKNRMMSPVGDGPQEFSIESTNKPPISRPINSPSGSPVDLLSKAIEVLSRPPDEVDLADDIDTLIKDMMADDDLLDADKTNWEPLQRPSSQSVSSGHTDDDEDEDAKAKADAESDKDLVDVEEAVVDTTKKVAKVAANSAKQAGAKIVDRARAGAEKAAAAVSGMGIPEGTNGDIMMSHHEKQGEEPEALTIKAAALLKSLNDFEDHLAVDAGDYEGIVKALSNALESMQSSEEK
tara:strand:+ start:52 stop:1053 length:1002 start_codon:yes stop_codon:yes gene_type:complete